MSQDPDLVQFLTQISETNPKQFKNLLKSLISFSHGSLDQSEILTHLKMSVQSNKDQLEFLNQNFNSKNQIRVISLKQINWIISQTKDILVLAYPENKQLIKNWLFFSI